MLKAAKQSVVIIISILIGTGIGLSLSAVKSERNVSVSHINSELYDLDATLNLLELWHAEYSNDPVFEKNVKHLILNTLMAISIVKPDVNELQGVPLDALGRLINVNKELDLSLKEYEEVFDKYLDYLSFIENDIESAIETRNSAMVTSLQKSMYNQMQTTD